jgi:hypothetical protein
MSAGLVSPEIAYYSASIADFLSASTDEILGHLAKASRTVEEAQRNAWLVQVDILKHNLQGVSGALFLEFVVPRIGSRIDAVLIYASAIVLIEFKEGAAEYLPAAINQVWDYGLDLKNFHAASAGAPIFPLLLPTEAIRGDTEVSQPDKDGLYVPMRICREGLKLILSQIFQAASGRPLEPVAWAMAPYRPTPSIIAAAQALYSQHTVAAISRSDAGAQNLAGTSGCVEAIIDQSKGRKERAIIFVTGVPGAGKTLVGLDVATKRRDDRAESHAVYLSGNGPLVAVLREALARDELRRLRLRGETKRKGEVQQPIKAFIQNVHHFRDAGVRDLSLPPSDHVVIFDEAQRAWSVAMTSQFMKRRRGIPDFSESEPEFLISYMDRHPDWSVIICLVGAGQEINRGEAGIGEWLRAILAKFPNWRVYISPNLSDSEFDAMDALAAMEARPLVSFDHRLHLAVSMRSFRAEHVSQFVKAVLDCEEGRAQSIFRNFKDRFPIVLTRNLDAAKQWVRSKARGNERVGVVTSSAGYRLKPHAIDVRVQIDPVPWFLNDSPDTRSSMFLEDAATEFQVQGLELDWVCVTWDADFRFQNGGWSYHSFVGSAWNRVGKEERRRYLKNAYRVLLTRARQGMAIFIPSGDVRDSSRDPGFYDATFEYLARLGLDII